MYSFLPYVKTKYTSEIPIANIFKYVINKDRTI